MGEERGTNESSISHFKFYSIFFAFKFKKKKNWKHKNGQIICRHIKKFVLHFPTSSHLRGKKKKKIQLIFLVLNFLFVFGGPEIRNLKCDVDSSKARLLPKFIFYEPEITIHFIFIFSWNFIFIFHSTRN